MHWYLRNGENTHKLLERAANSQLRYYTLVYIRLLVRSTE